MSKSVAFGYFRKMSPAARSARDRRLRIADARLERALKAEIEAALERLEPVEKLFAFVPLTPPESNMNTIEKLDSGALSVSAAIAETIRNGASNAISSLEYDAIFKRCAVELFPQELEAGAIAKFMATAKGAEMLKVHLAMPSIVEAAAMKRLDSKSISYDVEKILKVGQDDDNAVNPYFNATKDGTGEPEFGEGNQREEATHPLNGNDSEPGDDKLLNHANPFIRAHAHKCGALKTGPYKNMSLREKMAFNGKHDAHGQRTLREAAQWTVDQEASSLHKREKLAKALRENPAPFAALCARVGFSEFAKVIREQM